MSKHKKTRKEKIIADYRHQVYTLENKKISNNNFTLPVNEVINLNTHIFKDVAKTGILSFSIVVAQVILYFLLKKNIISIFNLNY